MGRERTNLNVGELLLDAGDVIKGELDSSNLNNDETGEVKEKTEKKTRQFTVHSTRRERFSFDHSPQQLQLQRTLSSPPPSQEASTGSQTAYEGS